MEHTQHLNNDPSGKGRPFYTWTMIISFILLSIVRYYWPESDLTFFKIIILGMAFTIIAMFQELLDLLNKD